MTRSGAGMSRRQFLGAAGTLIVGFSLGSPVKSWAASVGTGDLTFDSATQVTTNPDLDSWIQVDAAGGVTFLTGRIEIGNGVLTALSQIVAEELDVPFQRVRVVFGDTDRVPNQGVTSASTTVRVAGTTLRKAAATARIALLDLAAERLQVPSSRLAVRDGVVFVKDSPGRRVSYGELIGGRRFGRRVDENAPTKSPADYRVVGQSVPRIDIPRKVTASPGDFVENVRVPGMVFARTLRAPVYGARLREGDYREVEAMPGVVAVVPVCHPGDPRLARVKHLRTMPGDFVAVVAEREWQALKAMDRLKDLVAWDIPAGGKPLPTDSDGIHDWMMAALAEREVFASHPLPIPEETWNAEATYRGPYHFHAPMSPAVSLADVRDDGVTVWSASQWLFGAREMVAQALGLPEEKVRVVAMDSSGLYGRREEFDQEVDVEAALVSAAVGRPVRLQWSRQDEFLWSEYRPPQVVTLRAGLDDQGRVQAFDARIRFAVQGDYPAPVLAAMGFAAMPYRFGSVGIEAFQVDSPLRTGFMRNVFHQYNVFALESFVDELAARVGADPVEFRLQHMGDARARAVLEAAVERAGWRPSGGVGGRGMGVACTVYENLAIRAYLAYVAEVEAEPSRGSLHVSRIVAAIDPGLVINPDGLRNQVEGGVIQALSWTLKEEVRFDREGVKSQDWASYPILRFPEVPRVEVVLLNRPEEPAQGIGEPVTVPVAPAVANALFDGTGIRVRQLPLTPERVKAASAGFRAMP